KEGARERAGSLDRCRRIRSRRDAPCEGETARSALAQAGDCRRARQGPASGNSPGCAETGSAIKKTIQAAKRDYATGQGRRKPRAPSRRRRRAIKAALRSEGHKAASKSALARQAR